MRETNKINLKMEAGGNKFPRQPNIQVQMIGFTPPGWRSPR
jgi:hypothetical protein